MVVHSGERLFAMDDDGFSDPYCIVAANNEKVRFSQSCIQLSFFSRGQKFSLLWDSIWPPCDKSP